MWSTCSMSTGHCSTQAPQVVHDHSTSGSMTPLAVGVADQRPLAPRPGPARSRPASCSAVAFSSPVRSVPPPASRYGALAYAWSRSDSTSSFGDSGLPVFQAGHCDWQRPHSVQVVKSSRPFQVNCSTWRDAELVLLRVGLLEVERLAVGHHRPQRAQRRRGRAPERLKKMLENARNRCQATPIVDVQRDHDRPGHRDDDLDQRDPGDAVASLVGSTVAERVATRARPRSGTGSGRWRP